MVQKGRVVLSLTSHSLVVLSLTSHSQIGCRLAGISNVTRAQDLS